jgi:tRNA(adenine34) deaminase
VITLPILRAGSDIGNNGDKRRLLYLEHNMSPKKAAKRWVASVKTDSTHPPEGLFTKDAATIARILASKKVSPKGVTSGLRMLTYFVNRAGKELSSERRAELEKAKKLLSERVRKEREKKVSPSRA